MNNKEIFKKVAAIIAELNEQYEYLCQNIDHLNELELELFAANADFLVDHIAVLQKLNLKPKEKSIDEESMPAANPTSPEVFIGELNSEIDNPGEETESAIPEWKFEVNDEPVESFDFEERATSDLFDRPLTPEELEVIEQKTQLKVIPEQDSESNEEEAMVIESLENEPIVADMNSEVTVLSEDTVQVSSETESASLVEEQSLTINQVLAAQSNQNTVSGQFVQRQVKDLKNLINLNDKLLFVRDLFNGYSLAYSEAIEILNRFESFESADNFLKQNYSSKNNWAEKQNVADKFYEILNKRFSN
ncbi:MAG: hypothetical protein FJY21_04965 [Bacteroidetes bacterium]|nr:hypothetical protein [Bacteroidota bacterium]